jgi:nucleotide-binding universal stress UspA family protein
MKTKKFIFATDIDKPNRIILGKVLNLFELGFDEIVIMYSTHLADWENEFAKRGIKSSIIIEKEISAPHILSLAQEVGASIIATSFNGKRKRIFSYLTAKKLVKTCTLPLLLINPADNTEEISKPKNGGLFDHVIFATDWSPASWEAFEYLLNFKEHIKELEIVHVISQKLTVRDLRILKEKLSGIRSVALDAGVDAEYHIYAGKIHEEIILAAKDYNATLVVMGTTRKSTIKETVRGSPSYKMAEETPLPTLLVPC